MESTGKSSPPIFCVFNQIKIVLLIFNVRATNFYHRIKSADLTRQKEEGGGET
jgi:hypothetical protein